MDFDESPEESAFRTEARAWLAANAPTSTAPGYGDRRHLEHAKAWQAILADAGWACITWPVTYGGRGGTGTEASIFAEEQAALGITVGAFAVGIGMAGPTIIAHGTPDQKERFLRPLLRGEEVWCQLFSEPGAGSDLAGLATRAVRDGDEWVVTGQKVWTSGAHESDWGILLARTDPDQPKHRGITYFLVDMHSPGIEIRPLRQMTGAAHFNEVFLTDVRIPHENVLGDVNGGWGVAMTTLANERVFIGGGGTGPSFDDLVDLARELGRTDDADVRQELAATHTRLEIIRYLGLRIRTATSKGGMPGAEASVMKLFYAGHLKRLGDLAMAIEGASGMLLGDDAPAAGAWQQQLLSAPSIRIAGGSDEVQRNIMGERVLGLPAEPRLDKTMPWRELATVHKGPQEASVGSPA